jgi:uncharacterized protein (TIGR03435 family)
LTGGSFRSTANVDADRIDFTNITLRMCIWRAYGFKPYQVIAPDWTEQERFVIQAKASGPAPEKTILEMLQTLLADRFKLALHREVREMSVYGLVVARNGPKLSPTKDDTKSMISGGTDTVFEGISMDVLANVLTSSLDRPVLDETGLKGKYDFKLTWAERKRKGPPQEGAPTDVPSVFTALPAMVGLRLEARRAPMEVLVVDHVERPTEN